ncbi:YadA family autotransporter adhesin [Paraburkholderia sacchari]|uniref:YadA family autotransporter adhesin n=1 Tax=Paraburkholderia sacchari TaxID=159450 RepID=UPI0024681DCF|nr:YadA-like family protein [Paraburkholderia sacchari]
MPGTVGQGGLEICSGTSGYSWGSSGGSESLDCSSGSGTSDGLAFSLNNAGDAKGGYGFGASTAQVAGYQNGTLAIRGASVMVYGPTTFDSVVTMSNQKIVQLAPGKVSADSTEAVNGSQLYALSVGVGNAVQYDSPAQDSVTLGGAAAMKPVALHNVANGELSATSTDAVNGGQLYATNSSISNLAGDVTNIQGDITNINGKLADAVVYDSSAHDSLTLGGVGASDPVALHNVANGELSATSTDAVNGGQLYATNSSISNLAGDVTNIQGDITNINGKLADAVVYDSSAHDSLTLGGVGASDPVALHNVANGELSATSTDAVNGGQLYATNSSISNLAGDVTNIQGDITNINGKLADAVVYDSSAHDSLTLGGVGASDPVALHNVANGELSATSTDAVNGGQLYATNSSISNIQGDITNINGKLADAVMYDSSAHDSVTLGNASDMKPVALHNVANGEVSVASTDAINGSQLYDAIQKFDGKSTHYIGINSTPNDGNYDGEGATGTAAIAVGANALASGDNALAIGAGATASHSNAVALGAGSTTAAAVATTDATIGGQDYTFAGSNPTSTVSIGSAGNERTLTNVAAGRLSASSTDAVNGSQLYATNTALNNLAQQNDNIVQYDDTSKSAITFGGAQGTKLINVAAGDVSASSTEAINGAQLYDVKEGANIAITKINNTLTTAGWGAQAASSDPTGYTYGGFIMDANGKVSNPAVLYVPNTIGTSGSRIVLDPGQGNSPYFINGNRTQYLPKGTVISNVANGEVDTDAANVGQVYDIVSAATGGGVKSTLLRAQTPDTANGSSGVNSAGLTRTYTTAAYYSQVSGLANNAGSQGPSDAARASGAGSIAIGSNAFTPSANGIALGVQAYAGAKDAVAIGAGSVANQSNTVSVGNDGTSSYVAYDANGQVQTIQNAVNTRRIVNLAAGQGDTDAVNVGQLRSVAAALGGGAGINAAGGLIAPSYSVGGTTVNTVGDAIANLDNRVQKNTAEIAALAADATSSSATVQSASSTATASPVVQMAAAPRSLLGASASTAGSSAVRSMAAVGDTSFSTDADAVHYDNADHSSVTLASTSGGNVKLSGLSNGALSLDSTDAVTGQQLYATNQQVDSLNQALQNISVGGSTATSINSTSGVAAASGSQSVAVGGGAAATGANSTAIGDKANASANNAVAIGANSIANRDNAVSVGAEGSERQIVNVAAGTSGTDAVNLNQLNNAMTQQSNAFGQQIGNLQNSINTVSKNAYAGVAAAMAMPNLTPSGPGRTVVAAGGGYYMGGSAAAVGVTYRSTNMHWLVNGGVSVTSTGNTAARAQVGYEF